MSRLSQNSLFYKKLFSVGKISVSAVDIAALCFFIFFSVYLSITVRLGVNQLDESIYFTYVHRTIFGDKYFINEGHPSQLFTFFWYAPFRIYYSLTGGTEGVILFFRYIYVAVKIIFGVYLYSALRDRGIWGLMAVAAYISYDFSAYHNPNYYNMSSILILLLCVLLFIIKRTSAFYLILEGFIFACAVVNEPAIALLYFAYVVFVLILRSKKLSDHINDEYYKSLSSFRSLLFITVGILILFIVFIIWLFIASDPFRLLSALKGVLSAGSDHTPMAMLTNTPKALLSLIKNYKIASIITPLYFIALLFDKKRLGQRRYLYIILLFVLAAVWIAEIIYINHDEVYKRLWISQHIPILSLICGSALYILCKNKDKDLMAFLIFGAVSAVLVNMISFSAEFFLTIVCTVPAVLLCSRLYDELRLGNDEESSTTKRKRPNKGLPVSRIFVSALCVIYTFSLIYGIAVIRDIQPTEDYSPGKDDGFDTQIVSGPFKGILSNSYCADIYYKMCSEIDSLKTDGADKLFITYRIGWLYLYADMEYSSYSGDYNGTDEDKDAQINYLIDHPDKIPDIIYMPFYDTDTYKWHKERADAVLPFILDHFDCDVVEGETGYLIKVNSFTAD